MKRDGRGRVEFIALPCPYNYGSVPGLLAPDGEGFDAIVLGPRLPRGHRVRQRVQAVVRFLDAGVPDDKLVLAPRPLTRGQAQRVLLFFKVYARCKRAAQRLVGETRPTRCDSLSLTGWSRRPPR